MRNHVTAIAVAWLLVQFAGLAVSPIALCCASAKAMVSEDDDACCAGLGPGQTCPLHRHHKPAHEPAAPAPDARPGECVLRSGCPPEVPGVASLIVEPGIVAATFSVNIPSMPAAVLDLVAAAETRSELPDIPPPRS